MKLYSEKFEVDVLSLVSKAVLSYPDFGEF